MVLVVWDMQERFWWDRLWAGEESREEEGDGTNYDDGGSGWSRAVGAVAVDGYEGGGGG